jgi:hypothetical protein
MSLICLVLRAAAKRLVQRVAHEPAEHNILCENDLLAENAALAP